MSRRSIVCLGFSALAVAALLIAVEPASAQRWGRGWFNSGYGYGNPSYYGGYGPRNYGYGWGYGPMYSGQWGYGPTYSGQWGYGRGNYPGYAYRGEFGEAGTQYSGTPYLSSQYSGSAPSYYGEGMTEGYYGTPSGGQSYGTPSGAGMGNQVSISIRVPENAEIWFDDQKTNQTGTWRSFISPPLDPNRDFVYHIRARWTQDGRTIDRTRTLTVHAGDQLFANFMQPASASSSRPSGTPDEQGREGTPPAQYGATPDQHGTTPAAETTNPPRTPTATGEKQAAPPPPSPKP